ncbi:MAG: acyl carrier protein [Acidimicrobiales bacterium]
MDRPEVLAKIADAAVEVLGVERDLVTETASFKDDLDADSLDLVEFVMAIEEEFNVSIPEDRLEGIGTVGEAANLVMAAAEEAQSQAAGSGTTG